MKKIYFIGLFLGLNLGALGIAMGLNDLHGINSINRFNYGSSIFILILTAIFSLITTTLWSFVGNLKKKYTFSVISKINLCFLIGTIFSPAYLVLLIFLLGVFGFVWVN